MSRERWGTFSVRDHLMPHAFVADILLYDRLVVPYPPGEEERNRWFKNGWRPDDLDAKLETLGDVAIHVPWDENARQIFQTQYQATSIIDMDAKMYVQEIRENLSYELTKALLSSKLLPELPKGVSKVWAMSAYTSFDNYKEDMRLEEQQRNQTKQGKAEHLAMILSHRFLVPNDPRKSDEQLLKDVLQLSKTDDFKRKRADFFKWQENIIEEGITDKKAIEEMEEYLKQYNDIIQKANAEATLKFVFLLIKVALGIPGILLGQVEPLVSNSIDLISYFKFDKKLKIDAGDCKSAAMLHDIDKKLKWDI